MIEWRDDAFLALRASRKDGEMPEVLAAEFSACLPAQREAAVARLARQGWFDGNRVILMLGIRQRQLAMIPVPNVPEAEWAEAARWQLQGALDYPPDETVLDVLRIGHDEPPARQQLAVFAVRRSALAAWLAPLAARKIRLEAVEVTDCAQRNLAALHPAKGRPVAMLSWREDSVVFSVTRGAEVLVSRSFDAAGTKAGPSAHANAEAAAEIAALAERVGLQLQRMLDTLERRSSAMAPAQILVLNHAQHASLLSQCAELTGLRVIPLDLAAMMHGGQATPAEAPLASDFFHLLGAALRAVPTAVAA